MFTVNLEESFLFVIACPSDHQSFISPFWQAPGCYTWESVLLRFTAPETLLVSGSPTGEVQHPSARDHLDNN